MAQSHGVPAGQVSLSSVELRLYAELDGSLSLDNGNSGPCQITWGVNAAAQFLPSPAIGFAGAELPFTLLETVPMPYTNGPPPPWDLTFDYPANGQEICFAPAVDPALWSGVGTLPLSVAAPPSATGTSGSCGAIYSLHMVVVRVRATVQYGYCVRIGTSYCACDGGGAPPPCGNAGGPDEGCANSTGLGARLVASGSASAGADDLAFSAQQLPRSQPALLFAGTNAIAGGAGIPFGDGLRCAGGALRRLGVRSSDAGGNAAFGPGLGGIGGWVAGDVRRFQVQYRDPLNGPCGARFNLTNGFELVFGP